MEFKDAEWVNLTILRSPGLPDAVTDFPLILKWRDLAIDLHRATSVNKFEFVANKFSIKFIDGRKWTVTLFDNMVSYQIPPTDVWNRDYVLKYLSPLLTSTIELFTDYNLFSMDGTPVP